VISGSLDGRILIWDAQNLPQRTGPVDLKAHPLKLHPLIALDGHPGPSRCVRFNPRYNMMVSAGAELVSEIPRFVLCKFLKDYDRHSGYRITAWIPRR
jgi:COMPASS component SWD2